LLRPLAAAVLVLGWVLAVVAYFAIGTETCVTTQIPIVGGIETCQDTTATAIIMVLAIGFGATLAAVLLWTLGQVLRVMAEIAENTRDQP
jgi:hypothetical protein